MARTAKARGRSRAIEASRGEAARALDGYARLSMRPLYVLMFLAPLVVFYEVTTAVHVSSSAAGVTETIRAHRLLSDVFQIFGVGGLYLPGILLAVVLLVWHILVADPWKVRGKVLGWMLLESVAWTVPLLVLGTIVWEVLNGGTGQAMAASPAAAATTTVTAGGSGVTRSLLSRLTIAVGAGLYEELLFRMLAIGIFHAILVDVMGINPKWGGFGAVLAAAMAFAVYHDLGMPGGGIDWARMMFFVLAGLYFGMVYALRGFGIVVAVHALYDIAVLLRGG